MIDREQANKDFADLSAVMDCRAGKLLLKGKRFIVVAVDEPYFEHVYNLIRQHERREGRWTEKCEAEYQIGCDENLGLLQERVNKRLAKAASSKKVDKVENNKQADAAWHAMTGE